MKGLKKQLMGTLLATAVSASALPVMAQVPADVEGTRFEEPIQVLSALKIMIGDENGAYRPDDTIIRSEVTKMVIHALGLEDAAESSAGATKFPDVPTDHWANGYINLATAQGIIIGDDNGNFRPNDSITYAEAMTIMVRALGYEPSAQQKGGFPNGYILVGSSNGMSKNVQGSTHTPITRGNVAYLTYNSLTTNLMEQTGFGTTPTYEVVDKTLLKDRLKVVKGEGQITAIQNSSITGTSSLTSGQVKIDDEIFDTAYNMNNLLGYNVVYYAQEDSMKNQTIILAMPVKEKNSAMTISADLFEKLTTKNGNKAIEYFKSDSDSRTQTAELSKDATLVYNGKYNEMSDELLNMKDKSGNINLLDTDRDGKYDIVFVTNYKNMVVEEVTSTNKIVDKYGLPTLKLDEDEVDFRITKGFNEVGLDELMEWDVLSVAESLDKELYDIVVSNEKVDGKVSGSDDKGYYIGGKHYKVAANYTNPINIGLEGTFFLDVEGKIAAIDTTGNLSSNYAYMTKAYEVPNDEIVKIKVFTKDGVEKLIDANEKIRFNGVGGQKATEVVKKMTVDGSVPEQLITYSVNSEGKLTELNTAIDNTANGNVNLNKFTKNYVINNAVYNERLGKLNNIAITDETIIFDIPEGSTDYSIADKSMFEDEQKYNIVVYDRTEDFTAKAIVVTNAHFQTNAESPIAVVKSVATGTNNEDETTDILNALIDGEEKQLFTEDAGMLIKGENNKPLEAGDVIQYKTNKDGEIVSIRVLMDISTKGTEKEEKPMDNLEIVYGKVTKKFASSINVTVNGGEVKNFALPKDINVYSVDTTITKNNITVATAGDIQAFDEEEGNRVFVKLYKGEVQEVVIIK